MENENHTSISVRERLLRDFPKSEDFRYEYDEEFLDTYLSAQIRALRESRGMTQAELAKAAKTGQSKISAMESGDYHSWSGRSLRKLARAFGVRLFVTFESWGDLLPRLDRINRADLVVPRFEDDSAFEDTSAARSDVADDRDDNVVELRRFIDREISSERSGLVQLSNEHPLEELLGRRPARRSKEGQLGINFDQEGSRRFLRPDGENKPSPQSRRP